MGSRRPSADHEAVQRRLALLSAELAAVRSDTDETEEVAGEDEGVAAGDGLDPPTVVRPGPTAVPLPGRHASRRAPLVTGWVPATLRGRAALGAAQLTVVAVFAAVGVALAAWWLLRADADRTPLPQVEPASSLVSPAAAQLGPDGPEPTGAAPSTPADDVTVDVAGRARRPGIVVLPAGSRVVDALEAAGGARRGVDLTSLNLARLLVDGEQILVGVPGTVPPSGSASTPGAPPALVDLNTADAAALETLPGVGPVTAEAILSWRTEHGRFTAVEELLEVDGIGEATLAELAPHVTV